MTRTGSGLTGAGGAALLRVDFGVLAVDDTLDLRLGDHTFLPQAASTITSLVSAFKRLFLPLIRPPCFPSFHFCFFISTFISLLPFYLLPSLISPSVFLVNLSFSFLSFPASPYSFLTSLSLSSLSPFVHPSFPLSFLAFFHLLHLRSPPSLILNLHLLLTTCLCCFRSEVRGSHRMSELKQHTVC